MLTEKPWLLEVLENGTTEMSLVRYFILAVTLESIAIPRFMI